LDWAFN